MHFPPIDHTIIKEVLYFRKMLNLIQVAPEETCGDQDSPHDQLAEGKQKEKERVWCGSAAAVSPAIACLVYPPLWVPKCVESLWEPALVNTGCAADILFRVTTTVAGSSRSQQPCDIAASAMFQAHFNSSTQHLQFLPRCSLGNHLPLCFFSRGSKRMHLKPSGHAGFSDTPGPVNVIWKP